MKNRWQQVEEIFQAIADLPEHERGSFLDRNCGSDSGLRREVESLIENLPGAATLFASRLDRLIDDSLKQFRFGDQIGKYRIVREIGSGGMATVYLAYRDDGQFQQQVAVKLMKHGVGPDWAANRFRYERQVLARLAHPNIAQLVDGGSTPEGLPYLVMEYIEGRPIALHCRECALPVNDRLLLFLGVCQAVAYAHRNLVVHRDIKPGNILVTLEGIPKLLDFGISKLLDPFPQVDIDAPTAAVARLMTPEYASPEQTRGEPITTATDVYSLGTVLYEMLTDRCPYRFANHSAAEIERTVCASEPPKPSELGGKVLAGDLDNIVQTAMRKEPERRYPSVDHLAQDIRRYLQGLPVSAGGNTFGYKAGKFVRRHKGMVAAAALLAFTLVGAAAVTAWQARRVAEQVARVERQFLQFRKLGNAFLFDFHDKIRSIKDLSEARDLVLKTGIEYIDGLAREAGDDPIFLREIGRSYEKLGDLYGFRNDAGLGRSAEALANYRKVVAVLEPLSDRGNPDLLALVILSRSYCSAGEMLLELSGNRDEIMLHYTKCLDTAQRVIGMAPTSGRSLDMVTRASHLLGDMELASGNRESALKHYSFVLQLLEKDARRSRPDVAVWVAETQRRLGRARSQSGDRPAALQALQEGLRLARKSAAETGSFPAHASVVAALDDLIALRAHWGDGVAGLDPALMMTEMLAVVRETRARFPQHPRLPGLERGLNGSP